MLFIKSATATYEYYVLWFFFSLFLPPEFLSHFWPKDNWWDCFFFHDSIPDGTFILACDTFEDMF